MSKFKKGQLKILEKANKDIKEKENKIKETWNFN